MWSFAIGEPHSSQHRRSALVVRADDVLVQPHQRPPRLAPAVRGVGGIVEDRLEASRSERAERRSVRGRLRHRPTL